MLIPTEPIGSIPRPQRLLAAVEAAGDPGALSLDPIYEQAVQDTIERFEATGSPVITDGEQKKYHNFWTYCVHGLCNTNPDGFKIPFLAAAANALTIVTGVEITNAHGQAITSSTKAL